MFTPFFLRGLVLRLFITISKPQLSPFSPNPLLTAFFFFFSFLAEFFPITVRFLLWVLLSPLRLIATSYLFLLNASVPFPSPYLKELFYSSSPSHRPSRPALSSFLIFWAAATPLCVSPPASTPKDNLARFELFQWIPS